MEQVKWMHRIDKK